nr:TIGR03087 family PEP-CTERM/XrtA system glycosyltransferase [uncultured Desulfobacter sp.]
MKKKLLYICHRVPYPPNKGDKIRTFNEIKFLSRQYAIDLVSFADTRQELGFKKELERYCSSVYLFFLPSLLRKLKGVKKMLSGGTISQGYFLCNAAADTIRQLIKKETYRAIFCFSSPTAEYVFKNISQIQNQKPRPILIMDFCDVDSDKWAQYASKASLPMKLIYNTEAKRLLAYEQKINQHFDASVFVSAQEAGLFKQKCVKYKKILSVSNGVDFDFFSKVPTPSKSGKTIMFAGAMDYYANIEGVTWFCHEILPLIRKKEPDASFIIVGSNPDQEVKKLGNIDGVTVTGFVEDIRTYYNKADICVIPLRIARGIQNKVLEAMSMEKAIVSTPQAFTGIEATPGTHLILAENKTKFANEVVSLLHNPAQADKLGKTARTLIEKKYNWNTCLNELEKLIAHSE